MSAATKGALGSEACQVQQPTGVSFVHRTPDRQLLSLLGVLRRPATPADQVNHQMFAGIPDVYAGSIRRALSAHGETYYLAVSGFDRAASIPSDRCFALQKQALARYLPKIPAALRAQTTALQAGYIAWARGLVLHSPRDGVCLVDSGRSDNGTSCGITAAQIKGGGTPDDAQGVFIGIVPDAVASVTLDFPAAGQGHPAHSAKGLVTGDVYAIRAIGSPQPPVEPEVIWRSAQGRVIKRIPVLTPAMERAACQKEPTCTLIKDGGLTETSSSSSSSVTHQAHRAPGHERLRWRPFGAPRGTLAHASAAISAHGAPEERHRRQPYQR